MKRENFNTGWKVWKGENPFELVAAVPPHAKPVTLPYDAMFHEEQQEDSVNKGSTGFLDGGAYKYHKTFFVPEDWRGGKVMLWFEGVYRHAAVFVNQSLAGERAFGYSEFGVEIQDYLRFGQENQVLVTVKCGTQNSRWYSGAGIYREVYLLHSPTLRVLPGSLRLTTLSVEEGGAAVEIAAEIENGDVTLTASQQPLPYGRERAGPFCRRSTLCGCGPGRRSGCTGDSSWKTPVCGTQSTRSFTPRSWP